MADRVKEQDNKDAQSGRPVQLDREQGGKPGQQQGGQHDKPQHDRPQQDKPQHDKQGMEHGQKPGQPQPNR
jgi:hypothetical protein